MSFVIIDNKKVNLTPDEFNAYNRIVASYTQAPYQRGEDFFIDLFEVDEEGIIIFLKPPSQRQVSLEIFLFCVSIMTQQHLRKMQEQVSNTCKKMEDKLKEMNNESKKY